MIPVPDDEQNAILLGKSLLPNTTYVAVGFSRPLVTSDDNDEDLDRPLYLHFGFGPFDANSSFPVGDPGANRWISRSPIQFECNRNCT